MSIHKSNSLNISYIFSSSNNNKFNSIHKINQTYGKMIIYFKIKKIKIII